VSDAVRPALSLDRGAPERRSPFSGVRVSRADVVALRAAASALAAVMHAVGVRRPSSLLAPVAFGLPIVLLAGMVTASDTLASGVLSVAARLDRDAREEAVRVRWRQFGRAFRRYVAETSDRPDS
jgi:hypothetical protein